MVSGTVLMPTAPRAEGPQHADLGRRLELRAHDPGVDAFVQRKARAGGRGTGLLAQDRVVGGEQVDEAPVTGFAEQGRELRHVDVVTDQHHLAGAQGGVQAAGGIGLHQHPHADGGEGADDGPSCRRRRPVS